MTRYLPRATGSLAGGACGGSAARANDATTTSAILTNNFSEFTTISSDYLSFGSPGTCGLGRVSIQRASSVQRLGVDGLRTERRHLLQWIARAHAHRDHTRAEMAGLDAAASRGAPWARNWLGTLTIGTLDRVLRARWRGRRAAPASSRARRAGLHRCGSSRSCHAGSRARRARSGVAAAIRGGARQQSSAADCAAGRGREHLADPPRSRRFRRAGQRVAIRRKLQRAETQHRHRRAFVAGAAVVFARESRSARRAPRARRSRECRRPARAGILAVRSPDVAAEAPGAVRAALDVARLDARRRG